MSSKERDILSTPSEPSPSRLPRPTISSTRPPPAAAAPIPSPFTRRRCLELLKTKADIERELETWVPNCTRCGLDVHWVSGLGVTPGHWAHREPAPHGEPAV
jgi:hypothetical protein